MYLVTNLTLLTKINLKIKYYIKYNNNGINKKLSK